MNSGNYSVETVYQIWDDGIGDRIEVGSDSDGLDMIEIRELSGGKCIRSFVMNKDVSRLVASCICKLLHQESQK